MDFVSHLQPAHCKSAQWRRQFRAIQAELFDDSRRFDARLPYRVQQGPGLVLGLRRRSHRQKWDRGIELGARSSPLGRTRFTLEFLMTAKRLEAWRAAVIG